MAAPPTPLIRFWRTSFLTLRDESLTTPLPTSSSISHIFHNHIFSQSYSLLSAAPQLPSHEVLSDILFLMELVAASCSDQHQDCVHIYTQISRLIHDICRRVTFNLNSSSFTNVLDCFRKMLDLFLGKVTTSDELTGSRSTATMIPAVECLQAIRCVINSCHRRWLQSEDALLVKFLLDVIVSSHAVSCGMPRSICKEKSIEINTGLSTESSSSELQTIAFEMLGETISRAGSSFPVDIWRSIIEVVRKTMDVLALKSPVAEDNIMCRFYESFLGCLHLILIDPKCSVSDHVSVFVSVLRTFLTYGVSSRSSSTSLLIGHEEKGLNIKSPQARLEQVTRSDRVAYRPPHLRKKESSNVKHNIVWHSQNILDHESSTVNATSSDSDFSDGDGSTKESGRGQNSRIRVAAIICIQDLCQMDSKSFSMQWSLLLPTSDVLRPRTRDATLVTCLLFDPSLKARMASASTLVAMLDGPSSIFLQVAEYKESNKFGSFTALSSSLGQILLELHRGILYLIQHEAHGKLLALLFKILRLVISSTPYSRMPPNLLPNVVTSLRTRIEDGFRLRNDHSTLLAAALGCLTLALSTSPSSAEVRKMLYEEAFSVTEKKTGALFMLFEYSMQWSCPTICLEALQALKAVCHNYPNIVNACWEQVSATVHGFLSIVFREVPSGQAGEHVGSPTAFMSEKVLTSAIKVLDECLRAVSGFQGTEDLSDDKLVEIPFASDCIRVKKVSSAPSYDLEGKDDDLISFEACNSGNQQWCEVIEKHMPLILCHSSAMVRAASVTCFAGMTSAVFISFTKEKQNFILSSLVNAAIQDDVPSVRSAACRAIGVISCFPQVCQSAEVLDRFIHAVEINSRDALISVRITASWALANICDAICHYVSILPLGHMGSSPNPKLLASLTDCALHLTKDGDKVKSNAVRALGYIARIFECSKSRFEDISVNCQGGGTEVHPSAENLMVCQQNNSYHCQLSCREDLHRLDRIVKAFISCITTGNVKVQWNVCHALGNLFLNETLRLQEMDWAPVVFGILLQLLRDSSNFKIRIQAAAALAVPASVHDYGASFSGIVRCVEDILENIGQDQISGPSNFKYMVSLQKQLTLTMLHVLRFTSSTNDDQLKDFLVKKALVLEDWLKGLCSSIEGKLDVPVVDQKKVMLSSAIQSLIEVYKGKHQDVIAQKFEELKNTI
ncbi:PREDICTED: HEAT repeat-containing protein 6 isoform X1 [Lupinus angustifolius]|uniref:HEAT repeat-containing protein 6 isoform X1 n=1 Tax=Lupinus angustifolius TaxID=3871 RepID=UPI00092F200C|nr:PREDICTED: HEAT repeat-containing protein 6 isoform X1 [Lupinus angustifolius]XP_019458389.1 PREDICTED: HEAT repeat-containing protein 6 isoform X1 [Lupinus angustifolius]